MTVITAQKAVEVMKNYSCVLHYDGVHLFLLKEISIIRGGVHMIAFDSYRTSAEEFCAIPGHVLSDKLEQLKGCSCK